jgi:hypothetical protein
MPGNHILHEINYVIDYYRKDRDIPIILDILKAEGLDVTKDCIKSHSKPKQLYDDVIRGIFHVKSLGKNVLVYTNVVFAKERISKENDIKIIDIKDLEDLCKKHKRYELMDLVTIL